MTGHYQALEGGYGSVEPAGSLQRGTSGQVVVEVSSILLTVDEAGKLNC